MIIRYTKLVILVFGISPFSSAISFADESGFGFAPPSESYGEQDSYFRNEMKQKWRSGKVLKNGDEFKFKKHKASRNNPWKANHSWAGNNQSGVRPWGNVPARMNTSQYPPSAAYPPGYYPQSNGYDNPGIGLDDPILNMPLITPQVLPGFGGAYPLRIYPSGFYPYTPYLLPRYW